LLSKEIVVFIWLIRKVNLLFIKDSLGKPRKTYIFQAPEPQKIESFDKNKPSSPIFGRFPARHRRKRGPRGGKRGKTEEFVSQCSS
jgi:hypothetical protein